MRPRHLLPAIAVASVLSAPTLHAASYHYTDLGALMDGRNSYGAGVNNSGQVVGWSDTPSSTPWSAANPQAFSYSAGSIVNMDTKLGSSVYSYANGINNSGKVVGGADNQAFIANSDGSGKVPVPSLSNGAPNTAMGINDFGTVVGYSATAAPGEFHAFSFDPTSANPLADLGTLGGLTSYAYAINTDSSVGGRGKVVGASDTTLAPANVAHAFVVNADGSHMNDLGNSIDTNLTSQANNINNNGTVVGQYYDTHYDTSNQPYSVSHAFAIDVNVDNTVKTVQYLVDLSGQAVNDPNNYYNSAAIGINSSGKIVGISDILDTSTVHAVIVEDGVHMMDLNDRVLNMPMDTYLWSAVAINDIGQITGIANLLNPITQSFDIYHAYLLTPNLDIATPGQTPEPPSLWLLLSGLAVIRLSGKSAIRGG